ncbi:hypothetical protein G3F10_168 [Escherichia phage vB_EcoM-G3F10]|nr:hypothetical protein CHD94UKE2_169 [Escherichia phage vB_EcoM-CHD94UKE2]QZI81846.1 hypothetical protein G3F7_169 [Escherichia phage vB_EcoM-G3F7]QZI82715.1 hypothetical protein G3F10_168 [Escherichia phage vB_EcoM-G3F10]QZI84175.1 hypothetical protein PM123_175 [Escherichia phage vB_EcoM-PM123]
MRIIIVLRPRQFYGVPLECYSYSGKCMLPRGDGQSGVRLKAYIYPSVYILSSRNRTRNL